MTPARHPRIVLAGFTEAGKTSLLRTLLQEPFFGANKSADPDEPPDRYVPRTLQGRVAPVSLDGRTIAEIHDTPGFRRVAMLLEAVRPKLTASTRPAERQQIVLHEVRRLRDMEAQSGRAVPGEASAYMHEDQALEAAFTADVVIYVVDAKMPPGADDRALAALLHEMRLPVVGVQNRAAPPGARGDYREDWSNMLKEFGVTRIEVVDAWTPADGAVTDLMRTMRSVVDPDRRPAFDHWTKWHAERMETALEESAEACADALRDTAELEQACSYSRDAAEQDVARAREEARSRLGSAVHDTVMTALRKVWQAHRFPTDQFRASLDIDATRLVGLGDGVIAVLRGALDAIAGWFTRQRTEYHRTETAWLQAMARRMVHAVRRIRSFGHANQMVVDVSELAVLSSDDARALDGAIASRAWVETADAMAAAIRGAAVTPRS